MSPADFGPYAAAAAAVVVALIAWRGNRRAVAASVAVAAQDAAAKQEGRLKELNDGLDDEIQKRRGLEAELDKAARTIELHERRIGRLEAQIRSMGAVPVNGAR